MRKRNFIFLISLMCLVSCGTTSQVNKNTSTSQETSSKGTKSGNNLYKGKDLVIAVTLPQTRNDGYTAAWIPQYFQDSLTGNFAHYSKMTVLDRSNESLIIAQQELSETGFYTDENAAQLGQMTNASLVVVGSIQQIGGMYEVNFRINDISSNEIKSSINNRYSYSDLENGKAVNEITKILLEDLGIELSENEKAALSKVNKTENSSVQNLAKGMNAEKSNDYISALVAYSQVEGSAKNEAQQNIYSMLQGSFDSSNIQNRVAFYKAQTEKWNAIFAQLKKYMNDNVAYLVYDFSAMQDKINMQKNTVDFIVSPGIKCFFNRTAMKVYATVLGEWNTIVEDKENDVWTKAVEKPHFGSLTHLNTWESVYNLRYIYNISIALVNGDGDIVKKSNQQIKVSNRVFNADRNQLSEVTVSSQKKYYESAENHRVYFNGVNLNDVTGDMSIKIISATCDVWEKSGQGLSTQVKKISKKPLGIFSAEEWKNLSETGEIK